MNDPVGWMLIGLSFAWGTQAVLAVVVQRKLAERAAHPQTERFAAYRPVAALIVPFKGIEPALQANLHSLFTQNYPDYRLVLVVEDETDPTYPLLQEAIAQHPDRPARIIAAGAAGPDEGQKVHNLIAAVEYLQQQDAGEEVWVFADSDAVPGPDWLGELVGPLWQERTAVTTGFRWLIPEPKPGESRITFWAKIASILNSATTGFIRREQFTHAWGGSMAMRVSTAEDGGLIGRWRGAISDDYQVTRMCRDLGRRIYFVPECLVASPVDYDFKGVADFAYRQYLITRIHVPFVYLAALAVNSLYFLGLASTIMLLVGHRNLNHTFYAMGVFAVVFIANQARATYRRLVVQRTLGAEVVKQLQTTLTLERWTTPLWMGINLLLLARAGFGRTITWRNIRYQIDGPQKVQRLDPVSGV